MNKSLLFLLPILLNLSCTAQTDAVSTSTNFGILFYNVENLYDTINDVSIDDEEFLPAAQRNWNAEKYETKINHIAQVIATAAPSMPTFVGLCEIENKGVVKDLVKAEALAKGNYDIVHFDSPDERGIDVALLYNKSDFKVKSSKAIHVTLPGETVDFTRDILLVTGILIINGKPEELNIFVNHWPSRSEGEEVSAPKRAAAATVLRHAVDSLQSTLPLANIIIIGDFNDTPFDNSIQNVLKAKADGDKFNENDLVDLMASMQANGSGSYNYKGNWQALDQIIVSASLLNGTELDVDAKSVQYVKQDWMLYHNDKYGDSPNRTYAGPKYIGGYSDHLPSYVGFMMK